MACKMNLWSLTLLPGEQYPMYIRRDFQITNVALGEELRSTDGRSVVKVTHQPVPPFGDSDSEFDSDIDIDDDEELDSDEEEFELDEEEGFKLTPKKGKGAAKDDEEEEDEEDEEDDDEELDDEDDEDDEDFDDDEIEETNVICSLTAGKIEQASVDLTFVSGDAVMFEVTGENAVHLLGNYIYQPGFEDSDDDDSDYDSHDDYSDLYDEDEELEEDEDIPVGKITEIAETLVAPKKAVKADAKPAAAATENKKRKADAIESPAPKAAATEATEELSKAQKKKLAKKAKRESTGAESVASAPAQEKKAEPKKEQKQQKRTLPSGLIIEDVKVGDGPAAKGGKRLGMRYIGKLENGKQFDANTSGKPFSFVLGRGEVIKGWDEGLAGMAVGGERRLTIPAALAYGNQKLPGIPKGSTLKFDVKLVSIN